MGVLWAEERGKRTSASEDLGCLSHSDGVSRTAPDDSGSASHTRRHKAITKLRNLTWTCVEVFHSALLSREMMRGFGQLQAPGLVLSVAGQVQYAGLVWESYRAGKSGIVVILTRQDEIFRCCMLLGGMAGRTTGGPVVMVGRVGMSWSGQPF